MLFSEWLHSGCPWMMNERQMRMSGCQMVPIGADKNHQQFDMCNNFSFLFKILFVYIQHCIYGRKIRSLPAFDRNCFFIFIKRTKVISFILKLIYHGRSPLFGWIWIVRSVSQIVYVTPVCFACTQSVLSRRAYIFFFFLFN